MVCGGANPITISIATAVRVYTCIHNASIASQGIDLPDLPPEVFPGLAQVPRQGASNTTVLL